jgi:hypothetical protein
VETTCARSHRSHLKRDEKRCNSPPRHPPRARQGGRAQPQPCFGGSPEVNFVAVRIDIEILRFILSHYDLLLKVVKHRIICCGRDRCTDPLKQRLVVRWLDPGPPQTRVDLGRWSPAVLERRAPRAGPGHSASSCETCAPNAARYALASLTQLLLGLVRRLSPPPGHWRRLSASARTLTQWPGPFDSPGLIMGDAATLPPITRSPSAANGGTAESNGPDPHNLGVLANARPGPNGPLGSDANRAGIYALEARPSA